MQSHVLARVFIAAPSDLNDERDTIRETMERFNAAQDISERVIYEPVGWGFARGTARRPQDAINELVTNCDFAIVMFKCNWGSDPGGVLGYSSGTEEELFEILLALSDREHRMKDLWLVFVESEFRDEQIVDLRQQIEKNHALLYEDASGSTDLERKLYERLLSWGSTVETKSARNINLVPRSGKDILGAAKLRRDGEQYIRLGLTDKGLEKLRHAGELGGLREKISYSRALGRIGDVDGAISIAREARLELIENSIDLQSSLACEVFVTDAGLLRRRGNYEDAISHLGIILGELDDSSVNSWKIRSRILDERGLASREVGRVGDSRRDFETALKIREQYGNDVDVVQSRVNLLRLETYESRLSHAEDHAREILGTVNISTPTDVHANAWLAVAQLRIRQQRPEEGAELAKRSYSLNEQMGNRSGAAKSLLVVGQCLRQCKKSEEARAYLLKCMDLNEGMGNDYGASLAKWQLDRIDEEKG